MAAKMTDCGGSNMVSDAAQGLVLIDEMANPAVQRTRTSRFAESEKQ
jgi:hypothetical protein